MKLANFGLSETFKVFQAVAQFFVSEYLIISGVWRRVYYIYPLDPWLLGIGDFFRTKQSVAHDQEGLAGQPYESKTDMYMLACKIFELINSR